MGENQGRRQPAPHETTWSQWLVAALSTLLVLGAIGFLVYDALRSPPTPPRIVFEVDSAVPAGDGFLVQFRARNRGNTTAARLIVEGTLGGPTGVVASSEATIDYVPAGGAARAGLYFPLDPRGFRLIIRAKGYAMP